MGISTEDIDIIEDQYRSVVYELTTAAFFIVMGCLILGQVGLMVLGLSIGYIRGFVRGRKDAEV